MNEAIYFKDWVDNGILRANQLIVNGTWKNREQVYEVMKTNSSLISFQYGKLKRAFPRVWLEHLCKEETKDITQDASLYNQELFETNTGDSINLVSAKTNYFYLLLLETRKCELNVLYFWQEKLHISQHFNWNVLFEFEFGKLFNNNVKQYSFKLLHRLLPFKENLVKWKIASDMICKQCNQVETISHVLLYCPDTKLYWKKIAYILYRLFHIDIVIDERIILTGYNVSDKNFILPNLMLMFAQHTIYRLYIINNFTQKVINVYTLFAEFKRDSIFNLKCLVEKKFINFTQKQFFELENS